MKFLNSINKTNFIVNTFLIFIILLFVTISTYKVNQIDLFYSYDPFYHYYISTLYERNMPYLSEIPTIDGRPLKFDYPTLFRPLTVIVSEMTSLDLKFIYKHSAIFLRIVTALLIYTLINKLVKHRLIALVSTFIFLFAPYLFYRSLISFPENMVLIFHILVYIEIVKSIQQKSITKLLSVYFGLSLLVHYRSAIVPAVGIIFLYIYLLYLVVKKNLSFKKLLFKSLISLTLLLIMIAPIISAVYQQYAKYAVENIGGSASLKEQFENTQQYIPPDIHYYSEQLSLFLLSALIIMIPIILFNDFKKKTFTASSSLFIVLSLFTFILTRGQQVGLYVPPLRMFSFFMISLIPIFALSLKVLYSYINRKVLLIFLTTGIVTLLIVAYSVNGWVGYNEEDLKVGSYVNSQINEKTIIIWDSYNPINMGINDYRYIEPDWYRNQYILSDPNSQAIKNKLAEFYQDKEIIIVSNKKLSDFELLTESSKINAYRYQIK